MEEEGARRKAMGAGGRGALGGLNEEDEEEDEGVVEEARRRRGEAAPAPSSTSKGHRKTASGASTSSTGSRGRSTDTNAHTHNLHDGRAGQRDRGGRRTQPFELDMDGATLLGRRHKRTPGGNAPLESSPLARKPAQAPDVIDAPQSPMHY